MAPGEAATPADGLIGQLVELAKLPAMVLELRRDMDTLRAQLDRSTLSHIEDLMDVTAAAKFLAITPAALRQAVHRGTIPVVRVGRRLRFRREDLVLNAS